MDIKNKEFYYSSLDLSDKKLPSKAKYVKALKVKPPNQNRDCAIIKLEKTPEYLLSEYIIIIPRDDQESVFCDKTNKPISLYVIDGSEYLSETEIDLNKKTIFLDIGIISTNENWGDSILKSS